jgi:Cys-rich protein (TIGR01571 family)
MFFCALCIPCGFQCMHGHKARLSGISDSCTTQFIFPSLFCCLGGALIRREIRNKYLIQGSCFGDCLIYIFCGVCAVTQEWQHVIKTSTGRSTMTICELMLELLA